MLLIASSLQLAATTYQWNSSSTTTWSNSSAWSPNGTPGADDTVGTPLQSGGAASVDGDRTVYGIDFNSGTGWTIRCVGGQSQTLTLGAGGLVKAGGGNLLIRDENTNTSTALNLVTNLMTVNGGTLTFGSSSSAPLSSLRVTGTTTIAANATLAMYVTTATLEGKLVNNGAIGLNAGPNASSTTLTTGAIKGTGEIRVTGSNNTNKTSTLKINFSGDTETYAGTLINGGTTTTLILEKTGTGTQILSGANTYGGGTTVSQGALLVANASGSGVGTGAVAVKSNATFGGTGIVALASDKTLTVETGGTLLGGDGKSVNGILTIANDVTFQTDSKIRLGLGAGGAHSSIARTSGTWSFASGQSLFFDNIGEGAQTGVVYSGIITGLASDPGVSGWRIANAGWTGLFSYANGSVSVVLNAIAIPEPASIASILSIATLLAICCARYRCSTR